MSTEGTLLDLASTPVDRAQRALMLIALDLIDTTNECRHLTLDR
jgi:hypothetical protein